MQRIFLTGFILTLLLGACVPNKNYVYLQKRDVNKKGLPTDTVVRSYTMQIVEYKIQPLDILSIQMESLTADEFDFMAKLNPAGQMGGGNMMMNQSLFGYLLDTEGNVEFPVVGKIKLSGLTIFEAEEKLKEVFKPYLKNPVARVRLLNFRFTVLGEVNGERQVISPNPRVTMSEAIGLAGGLTDMADRRNVKVIRQKGNQAQVFYLDLLDEDLITNGHYYVQQNDIIVVPSLRQRPFRRYWGQNLSLFVSTVSVVLLTVNLFN